jgi:hypothetical protein
MELFTWYGYGYMTPSNEMGEPISFAHHPSLPGAKRFNWTNFWLLLKILPKEPGTGRGPIYKYVMWDYHNWVTGRIQPAELKGVKILKDIPYDQAKRNLIKLTWKNFATKVEDYV